MITKNIFIKIFTILLFVVLVSCEYKKDSANDTSNETKLEFSESTTKEVEKDRYIATLTYQLTGNDSITLQNKVNQAMKIAVENAKSFKELKVSTGSYNVNQQWNSKEKKYLGWAVAQEIIIDSSDKKSLANFTGNLQENGFNVKTLTSYLSEEKRNSYKEQLISESIAKIKERANKVAKDIGKSKIKFSEINLSPNNSYYRIAQNNYKSTSQAQLLNSQKSFTEPVVEADTDNISVNVAVVVMLQD